MQSSTQYDFIIHNPLVSFVFGLLIGSIIGFNGIVILCLCWLGYCYRDTIINIIVEISKKSINSANLASNKSNTQSIINSWLQWSRNFSPFSTGISNSVKQKKEE